MFGVASFRTLPLILREQDYGLTSSLLHFLPRGTTPRRKKRWWRNNECQRLPQSQVIQEDHLFHCRGLQEGPLHLRVGLLLLFRAQGRHLFPEFALQHQLLWLLPGLPGMMDLGAVVFRTSTAAPLVNVRQTVTQRPSKLHSNGCRASRQGPLRTPCVLTALVPVRMETSSKSWVLTTTILQTFLSMPLAWTWYRSSSLLQNPSPIRARSLARKLKWLWSVPSSRRRLCLLQLGAISQLFPHGILIHWPLSRLLNLASLRHLPAVWWYLCQNQSTSPCAIRM